VSEIDKGLINPYLPASHDRKVHRCFYYCIPRSLERLVLIPDNGAEPLHQICINGNLWTGECIFYVDVRQARTTNSLVRTLRSCTTS
jgi:hypothetical protein